MKINDFLSNKGGAVCFFLCMLVFLFVTNSYNVKGVYIDSPHVVVNFYTLYIVIAVLSFFLFFLLMEKKTKVDFIVLLLFIRLLAHFIPIPITGFPPHFAVHFITSVICLVVYLIMYNYTNDRSFFIRMVTFVFVVLLFQVVVEFILSPVSLFRVTANFKSEIALPIGSSNYIAANLVPVFAFIFCNCGKKWKIFLTVMTMYAVLVTRSRTGCANFVLITLLCYTLDRGFSIKAVYRLLGYAFFFFFTIYYFLFTQDFLDKLFYMETTSSDARFLFWEQALNIFFDYPITGVGFYYGFIAANPHNFIFDILMRSGLVGMTIAICIILFIFRTIKNNLNDNFIKGCLIGLIAFVIHGLFEIVIFSYISDFIIWTFIGSMMGYIQNKKYAYD